MAYDDLRAFLAVEGQRLDMDVEFWEDEYRRYHLACIAHSLSLALARREMFNQLSSSISDLLALDCSKDCD